MSLFSFGFTKRKRSDDSSDVDERATVPTGTSTCHEAVCSEAGDKNQESAENVTEVFQPSQPESDATSEDDDRDVGDQSGQAADILSDSDGVATDLAQPPPKRSKSFQVSWLSDPKYKSWLMYDEQQGSMKCRFCLASKFNNNFTRGCKDLQKSALNRHMNATFCRDHARAIQDHEQRKATVVAADRATTIQDAAVEKALRCVYWLAKEEIASHKFPSLVNLIKMMGDSDLPHLTMADPTRRGMRLTYESSHAIEDFQTAQNEVVEKNVLHRVQSSPVISIMVDETSDVTVTRKLIVYAKSIIEETGAVAEVFISNVDLEGSATAETIRAKLLEVLHEKGIPLSKVTGLGTDGAAVMTGRYRGLGALLTAACPNLVQIHCVAHRLALASGQAADTVNQYKKVQNTVNALYNYFQYSAIRMSQLHMMQKVVADHSIAMHQMFSTRWLSFHGAIDALRKSYVPVVEALAEREEGGCAPARGLLREIKQGQFVYAVHFLTDALAILNRLSLCFQKSNLNIADIGPLVTSARQSLQSLKTAPGSHLQSLMDRYDDVAEEYRLETGETAITVRMTECSLLQSHSAANQFLQAVCDNLAARFPSLNVVDCLAVFDPRNLPEAGTDELDVYGSELIRQLVEHFNPQFALMDGQEELPYFPDYKSHSIISRTPQFGPRLFRFKVLCTIELAFSWKQLIKNHVRLRIYMRIFS